MQRRAPSISRVATMVLFALSCFGILLFLWVVFGGPTPLRAKGYRVTAQVTHAGQLAAEADVRISGVPVGRVKSISVNSDTGKADVIIEMQRRYAPIPRDTRLRLRTKTLLGETYVELTPGHPTKGLLPDGSRLPPASVAPSVQLDDILGAFNPRVRRAFQVWMQEQAVAGAGRGRDISEFLAQLPALEEQATDLLTVLDEQAPQLSQLISGTGTVFASLSVRQDQLRGLIRNSNRVFSTIARRDEDFAATWVALPAFQRETRRLLADLHGFINRTDPLVAQLTPAFRELSTVLEGVQGLAPDLATTMRGLTSAQAAGVKGLPAISQFLDDLAPFLGSLDPALAQLNPFLQFVGMYPNDLTSFAANSAAATQATLPADYDLRGKASILRTMNPLSPEGLAAYPQRLKSNRPNPYPFPRATLKLADLAGPSGGPPVFTSPQCTTGIAPTLAPDTAVIIGQTLTDRILRYVFDDDPANVPAPRCIQQGTYTASGRTTSYPQLFGAVKPPPVTFNP